MNNFDKAQAMFSETFMSMLKDKKKVVMALASAYDEAEKIENGLTKVSESVLSNPSDENVRKMLATTMKCVKNQSKAMKMLLMLCLVYTAGDNYASDVTRVLMRMGQGQEAMQEMFKQKLKGL